MENKEPQKDGMGEAAISEKNKAKTFTVKDIIVIIAIVAALGTGLVFSYINFTEYSHYDTAEKNAHRLYAAVCEANITIGSVSNSETILSELQKFNPSLIYVGASHTVADEQITLFRSADENTVKFEVSELKEESCLISNIEISGASFSFTYYEYSHEKIYICTFTEGILDKINAYDLK